jgi:hypothetical protein
MTPPFTTTFSVITPAGAVSGTGTHRSPKKAAQLASDMAWAKFENLCKRTQSCLSIGGEGYNVRQGVRVVGSLWDI